MVVIYLHLFWWRKGKIKIARSRNHFNWSSQWFLLFVQDFHTLIFCLFFFFSNVSLLSIVYRINLMLIFLHYPPNAIYVFVFFCWRRCFAPSHDSGICRFFDFCFEKILFYFLWEIETFQYVCHIFPFVNKYHFHMGKRFKVSR